MSQTFTFPLFAAMAMLIAAAATNFAWSQNPTAPQPRTEYEVLQERADRLVVKLPNRMIVIAQELRAAPVVTAQIWVKTGSIYEQEHVGAGLSHFLEHLLSGGTTSTRSEDESNAILGRIGASVNAATSLDNVHYYIDTTSDHTFDAINLLSDWIGNNLIIHSEFEREREVIQREFESGMGSPDRIFWKLTQQARYRMHPARHPTIGYLDEFLQITRDEIYAFYKRMYVPNNMVFVVCGDINKRQVIDHISALWSGVAPGELPSLQFPIEPDPTEPVKASGTATIRAPRLRLAWPGTRLAGKGDYALDLLAVVLGQGESSRLARTVRDEQRLVNTASAYNLSFAWGEGFFGIDAEVAMPRGNEVTPERVNAAMEAAREAMLAQVARIQSEGITEEELARAKRQVRAGVVYDAQTAHGAANRLARDVIGMGDPDYLGRYAEAVQSLTMGQIQQAAVEFLKPGRMIDITLMPRPADEPAQELARPEEAAVENAAIEPVNLDNGAVIDRMMLRLAATDQHTRSATIDPIIRHVLPNGLRVLVQRSTLVPAVSMQMYRLGGLLSDTPGREGVANAVAAMSMRGTATRSAQQIAGAVDNLGADLSSQSGNNTSYVTARSLTEDWITVLELFADVTLNPSFPDDEWERMRPRLVARIARQDDDWGGELNRRFRETYFGAMHPWSTTPLGRLETIQSLTTADLREFHRARLGAADAVLAIFGDVDPQEAIRQAERLFGSMPAKSQHPFTVIAPPAATEQIVTFPTQKPLAAVQIGLGPGITRDSDDYAALMLLTRAISSFPSGWLEAELRGKGPGLAYAVWAYQVTGVAPGYFAVGFNTQPASLQQALDRATAVIHRAKSELVDEPTLARAKAMVLTREFAGKQSNGDRAADSALNELYGLGLDEPEQFLNRVRALTAEDLKLAAEKYLNNAVTVIITNAPVPAK